MNNRGVRSLERLEKSASSARVLNLMQIKRFKGDAPDYAAKPFFANPSLNAAIILKHRLRSDERDLFLIPRRTATKIIVPIESRELKLGARFVFIGQKQFAAALNNAFGVDLDLGGSDHRTLRILDQAPTLDPFLLRELLRRHGLEPARCYFDLSEADTDRMFSFAQREIEPLVRRSMSAGDDANVHASRLTMKILANASDSDLEPLRRTLQLDAAQFQEGAFCWKAFLYYKWQLADMAPKVGAVLEEIRQVRPRDSVPKELRVYIAEARARLAEALVAACRSARETLGIYDAAYWNLVQHNEPQAFRDFLLEAPALFAALGERLGAIEHILSFWRYRFPATQAPMVSSEELADILMDFEGSLALEETVPSMVRAPAIIDAL